MNMKQGLTGAALGAALLTTTACTTTSTPQHAIGQTHEGYAAAMDASTNEDHGYQPEEGVYRIPVCGRGEIEGMSLSASVLTASMVGTADEIKALVEKFPKVQAIVDLLENDESYYRFGEFTPIAAASLQDMVRVLGEEMSQERDCIAVTNIVEEQYHNLIETLADMNVTDIIAHTKEIGNILDYSFGNE